MTTRAKLLRAPAWQPPDVCMSGLYDTTAHTPSREKTNLSLASLLRSSLVPI